MGKLLASLGDFIQKFFCESMFDPIIYWALGTSNSKGMVDAVYSGLMDKSKSFLLMSPKSWASGSGWSFINSISSAFISVGAALVMIFWLIGICTDSLDIRSNMRLEVALKQLAKLVVSEFLVTQSIIIVSSLFGLVNALCGKFNSSFSIKVSADVYKCVAEEKLGQNIILVLLSLVLLVMTVVAAGSILYLSIVRIFKVLMIVPYSAIATSTIASSHSVSSTTVSYWKYTLATILEASTMLMAVNLSGYLVSSNGTILDGVIKTSGSFQNACGWIISTIIILAVTMGAVKEAGQVTHRVLGA